ncbi:LytTR family transcriptional regulator DNA-binding domain-containing protein [Bacillus sp. SJS]|uniref:LytTR family transcriptional regulator DNA-binding domain-containing protein n=1 Tax=Bacillus sp. SJS TaxID=1423321 RepID=UPI0004DD6894|nr:LytTR family transcriptional regulator DNA-binding domain-containing protein [Bacillus sp. SJS]KZZ83495.1 ABC transporter ATP-binding protein [Bacillus sp. SJS]
MTFDSLDQVMKEEAHRIILKNVDLVIGESSHIGIKMSNEESVMLFDLITGRIPPSSGHIHRETESIFSQMKDEGLYDSLTVQSYLKFFKELADYPDPLEESIAAFSLLDVWGTKIKKLTDDQKRRVSLFRMSLFSPDVLLIENPLDNLSGEGIELYLKAVEHVRSGITATVITSNSIEDLLLLTSEIYRYNQAAGLEKTDLSAEETDDILMQKKESEVFKPNRVFKVTCKLADKTIFFSPDEIDYIESINSVSHLRINEEYFPTDLTMNDLEEKLHTFGFFRCHRSYLVNLQRVSELISYSKNSYTLILKGHPNVKVPLSRTRLEEMKQLLDF